MRKYFNLELVVDGARGGVDHSEDCGALASPHHHHYVVAGKVREPLYYYYYYYYYY